MTQERPLVSCIFLLIAGLTFSALGFGVTPNNPIPLVNSPLVPSNAVPGGVGFTLTVNGTGFVSSSIVNWNRSPRSTHFVSQSQLTAQILATDIAAAITASVAVTNPAPGGGSSNVAYFSVTIPKAAVPFSTTTMTLGGKGGGDIAIGDFNGNGKLDLAIPTFLGPSFVILLGNGDGTFQARTVVSLPRAPASIVTADFNGDGNLDLAMSEINNLGQVEVLLGNGDGTFQAAQTFVTGQGQGSAILAADLNRDGKLDLVIANQNHSSISVLLGNGDGTFQSALNTATGASPVFVAAGDFNGDGKLDLAVTNNGSSSVSILLGNDDGTFTAGATLPVNSFPLYVTAGDFNGDGRLDLAVATNTQASGSIEVLIGNGDGTFQSGVIYALAPHFYLQTSVADINGDGTLDLISAVGCCSLHGVGGMAVLLGNGDGTFQAAKYYALPDGSAFAAAVDLNGDGSMDIIESGSGPTLSIMLQTPAIFSPGSLSFGTVAVGSSQTPQTTTMTNVGVGPLQITGVSVKGANASDFSQTNNCPASLAQGASCTINVTFAPTSGGTRSATINVGDSGAPRLQGVTLKGTGTFAGLSPTSVSFGNQGVGTSSNPQTVTLTNLSSGTTFSSIKIAITGVNGADFSATSDCGSTLAAGAHCSIKLVFTPQATGSRRGTLNVTQNGTNNPAPVPLAGTGT
jgi:hypothetical protein